MRALLIVVLAEGTQPHTRLALRSMWRIARARTGHPCARCDSLAAGPAMIANDLISFVRPIDLSPGSCYSLNRDDHSYRVMPMILPGYNV
jgi:hypothetical protein